MWTCVREEIHEPELWIQKLEIKRGGADESTFAFFGGPGFEPQHLVVAHNHLQLYIQGPDAFFPTLQEPVTHIDIQPGKTLTHTKQQKNKQTGKQVKGYLHKLCLATFLNKPISGRAQTPAASAASI